MCCLLIYSLLLLLRPFVCPVIAADFTGPVVSVLDGDNIDVLHNHHPEHIRLSGIDCPEKRQAYGQKAKHAASDLAFGRKSRFRPTASIRITELLPM